MPSVADACTGCHETRMSSRGMHHSHQGPMVFGTEAIPFPGFAPGTMIGFYSGWQLPGYVYENGSHSEIEERCAACHMAQTPTYDPDVCDARHPAEPALADTRLRSSGMATRRTIRPTISSTTSAARSAMARSRSSSSSSRRPRRISCSTLWRPCCPRVRTACRCLPETPR